MTDFSRIFYPARSEHDRMVHKFIPDRTVDRGKLTMIFFQSQAPHWWASTERVADDPRDETTEESLRQLREVAGLLDIRTIDIPKEHHYDVLDYIRRKIPKYGQVLFLTVTRLDRDLVQVIDRLRHSEYPIIIGTCASLIPEDEWGSYRALYSGEEAVPDRRRSMEDEWYRHASSGAKQVQIVDAPGFVDVLLWEEFRWEFRQARLWSYQLPFIKDIVVPCLKQLRMGEPQFRLHWQEGIHGKYISEFALEIDWEPSETSRLRLAFRRPIESKPKSLRERFFGKSEKMYRYSQTEKDYICLQITSGYDVGCFVTLIGKGPERSLSEITREANRLKAGSESAANEFLEQNTEAVLQVGKIARRDGWEIHPCRTLQRYQLDDRNIRDAIKASIEMMADSAMWDMVDPYHNFHVRQLAGRLYEQKEKA